MKKIYEKPFMKDHKLLHTNNLLVTTASKLNDGNVEDDTVDDEIDEDM